MMAHKTAVLGMLCAAALILSYVESLIPFFMGIPGMKLGLANVVTLTAMVLVGRVEAGFVLGVRIVLATAFYGTFISFAFSLCGGALAYVVMCVTVNRFDKKQLWVVSVFAALALRAFEPSQTAVGDQYEISVTLLDYDKQSAGVAARGRSNEAADLNWKSLQRIASATDAPG